MVGILGMYVIISGFFLAHVGRVRGSNYDEM